MTQRCETCRLWSETSDTSKYGLCRPTVFVPPFWAAEQIPDMQTRTLRTEGWNCEAYLSVDC